MYCNGFDGSNVCLGKGNPLLLTASTAPTVYELFLMYVYVNAYIRRRKLSKTTILMDLKDHVYRYICT